MSPTAQRLRHRLTVAPMMDWTDRHCRFFHRLVAPNALLYSEMVTTGAILHGDLDKLLGFDARELPVALQLGGSEPEDLGKAARIGADWGYSEINLNCGCPSERVQKGAFGACLMREPELVADGFRAMQAAAPKLPITIKHRIGVDGQDDYADLHRFVGMLYEAGCRTFLVHARTAILKGLSPKENREIPPLKPALVRRLKADFPDAVVVYNGGLTALAPALALLQDHADGPALDGLMLGRAAYHDPWILRALDRALFPDDWAASDQPEEPSATPDPIEPIDPIADRLSILPALEDYFQAQRARGVGAKTMSRHWHGLFHGLPGARHWRREMSEGGSPMAVWDQLSRGAELARSRLALAPITTTTASANPSKSQIADSQASAA